MCEHVFTSIREVKDFNLLNCKGEVGPIDMFPSFSKVTPGPETVCILCYQIYGEDPGILLQDLALFDKKMRELQKDYSQHAK